MLVGSNAPWRDGSAVNVRVFRYSQILTSVQVMKNRKRFFLPWMPCFWPCLLPGVIIGLYLFCTGCSEPVLHKRGSIGNSGTPGKSPPMLADSEVGRAFLPDIEGVKTIYIARHGRTHMNRTGWINGQFRWDHLDSLGYKQRVGLFALLRKEPILGIFVSEMQRTQQTAEPLAAHFKLKPVVRKELNEFNGGVFQGMCQGAFRSFPPEDPRSQCDSPSDDPLVKRGREFLIEEAKISKRRGVEYRAPGGGESVKDVGARLSRFLARFPALSMDAEKDVLIVGHGGTNRFLLALFMGWSLVASRKIRQGHTQVFRLRADSRKETTPALSVFIDGKWRNCPNPPHPKKGLDCLILNKSNETSHR